MGEDPIATIVDAVSQVLHIPTRVIEPPSPVLASADSRYLLDIAKLEKGLVALFNLDYVLSRDEKEFASEAMAKLTHSTESLLDLVRESRLESGLDLVDVLFEFLDVLRVLNREVETGQDSGEDIMVLTWRLLDIIACAEGETTEGDTGASCTQGRDRDQLRRRKDVVNEALMHGLGDVEIRAAFAESCPMSSFFYEKASAGKEVGVG